MSLSDNQCYAGVEEAVEGWAVKLPFCIELLRNFNDRCCSIDVSMSLDSLCVKNRLKIKLMVWV